MDITKEMVQHVPESGRCHGSHKHAQTWFGFKKSQKGGVKEEFHQ
jgi:hypothetical protein